MDSLTDFTIKWQYPQPIGRHMRGKTSKYHHFKQKLCHKYSLVDFWAIWYSGTTSWLSGHLGPSGTSGKLKHFWDDPLACWHTSGTLVCWHTCWHSRQTNGIQTNDEHHPLNLVDFRLQSFVVGLQFIRFLWHLYIWGKAEKLPQPHKPKNMVKNWKMTKI